jgi:hypothetical protein
MAEVERLDPAKANLYSVDGYRQRNNGKYWTNKQFKQIKCQVLRQ